MVARVVGVQARPRMLVMGVPEGAENEGMRQSVGRFAPTVRFVTGAEFYKLRQREWDMLVMIGDARVHEVESHIYVIQIGGTDGIEIGGPSGVRVYLTTQYSTPATEFHIPDDLPDQIASLVNVDLVPAVQESAGGNQYMSSELHLGGTRAPNPNMIEINPFLMDGDGKPLAGAIKRGNRVEYWWIPFKGKALLQWIAVAISQWRIIDPSAFPADPEWGHSADWRTPEELSLESEIAILVTDRNDYIHTSELNELNLRAQLASTRSRVDQEQRRLLTAQGDDLVEEVVRSLEEIGFEVRVPDEDPESKGDKLEDIQVTDPNDPDWIALAEVRGYKRGAALNDLLRIARFVLRYVAKQGRVPNARWYIMNHFIAQDPKVRPKPLASNPSEVAEFSNDGGLVVDTVDLFKLRMRVRAGDLSKDQAMEMIKGGVGSLLIAP